MNENVMSLNLKFAALIKKPRFLATRKETIGTHAFQQMINPIQQYLYNFIYKSLNFREEANDVYQETVMRAFKYIRSFSNPEHNREKAFKTWIFTIAHNEIKNFLKKNKHLTDSLEDVEKINLENENNQAIRDIYEVAAKLKPAQRQIFFLFYYNRFSIKEIVDISGYSQGNIKFILNRAREEIKKMLGVKND